jgi:hypothetical protein
MSYMEACDPTKQPDTFNRLRNHCAYPEGSPDAHFGYGHFDCRHGFDGGTNSGPDI